MRRSLHFAKLNGRVKRLEPESPDHPKPLTAAQLEAMVAVSKLGAVSPDDNLHIARQVLGPMATDAEIQAYALEEFTESSETIAAFGTEADLAEVRTKRNPDGLSPAVQTARCRRFLEKLCEGYPE